jgi:hypothetical protein
LVGGLDAKIRDALEQHGCSIDEGPDFGRGRSASGCEVVLLTTMTGDLQAKRARMREGVEGLAVDGRLIVMTFNSAHAASRLRAMQGHMAAQPDSATVQDLVDLLSEEGLAVESIHASLVDPVSVAGPLDVRSLPPGVVEWMRRDPAALHHRLIACAKVRRGNDGAIWAGSVKALATPESVVLEDEHTRAWLEVRDARHRLLTMRDHVIALEAKTASAQARQGVANAQLKALKRKLRRQRTQESSQGQPNKRDGSGVLKLGRGRKGSGT